MSRRLSFTEKRRAGLAKKVAHLDRLETRNTITEPISVLGLSLSAFRGLAQIGLMDPNEARNLLSGRAPAGQARREGRRPAGHAAAAPTNFVPIEIGAPIHQRATAGGGGASEQDGRVRATGARHPVGDLPATLPSASAADSSQSGISTPWHPLRGPGGGAALPPRGGSSGPGAARAASRRANAQPSLPASTPAASNGGASAALLAAVAGTGGGGAAATAGGSSASVARAASPSPSVLAESTPSAAAQTAGPLERSSSSSGVSALPGSTPDLVHSNFSGPSQLSFPYFPLYVLDVNDGVVLYPGVDELATLHGYVILQAQVSGTTVSSYNWDTSGISSDATSISGSSTYQLSFTWTESNGTLHTDPITLSVTDSSSHTETYTYDFVVPVGSVGRGGGGPDATWPTTLSPDTVSANDPAWASDNVSVDSNSGSLDTSISLPGYNPNVPALALTYDSVSANPLPIIVAENPLSSSAAVPSQVSATLTFNSSVGTTYYYNTSGLNPGDVQQIALQYPTALATGRYSYSVQIVDLGSPVTTLTYSGTATVLNQSGSAVGDGWTLGGLEQIVPASGGVILSLGGGGDSLWFTGSFGSGGGTYTDPPGDYSTLVLNSGGSYTDTLKNGTQVTFNSGGYETATIDLNNQHITFSYNGSNQIATITDNYSNTTTFSYSGGYLQTIQDPAGRLTTLTHTGANLTQAVLPDSSTWNYGYSSGGQLATVEDPLTNVVSITYDSAGRVGTITRPDLTTEEFSPYQEQGWTNTGTSGSPATALMLAQAAATHTDPNGNTTYLRPDWYGLGMTGVQVDALGNVATYDLNANGLATVAIDQDNRISQFTYDSEGNITEEIYPDGSTDKHSFNSYSEALTHVDANNNTTSYTYNGDGDNTVIQDPLHNRTTMTYTATGRLQTVTDANDHTTTYQYDSQDRLTTLISADGTTEEYAYNSQGNRIKVTDERNNATTFSFDALNRQTGSTDALGDKVTLTYNADGDLTEDQEPTPAGQTARTTNYTYNAMNELTVKTDPLGLATTYGYDAAGNQVTVKDPMGRITTTAFDALNRPIVVTDPMTNSTTTVYDAAGQVIQVTDPLARITTTTYDNRGWVATTTDPLNNTTTYSYTATGKTASATQNGNGDHGEQYLYDYNADDELTSVEDPLTNLTAYSYDGIGNRITVTDPNGNTTTYAYDSTNELTTITDALGHTTVFGFDAAGNQTTVTDGLGHTTTTAYDALNRATTITSLRAITIIDAPLIKIIDGLCLVRRAA